MSVERAQAIVNGQTIDLTRNTQTGKWEATVTAPSKSSYTQEGRYYGVVLKAWDDAGNMSTVDVTDTALGDSLKLIVKEKVAPVIVITYPTASATITNNKPVIKWKVTDDDSGVNPATIGVTIDSGSTGMLHISMPIQTQSFLMNYKTGFTPVEFKNMVRLESKYAKILYLFFRSYRDGVDHTDYTLEHLKGLLGLENKYPDWYNFKRYVLLPAIEEINTKTDIMVIGKRDDYYNGLAGRKADSISVKEHAKVVVDSMAQKGSRGKAIYKITFRVSKQDSVIDDKLDFSGLLPDMESEE